MALTRSFQERVRIWVRKCLGEASAADPVERNHRFLEESLELVQAMGLTRYEAMLLVNYVFNREIGEPRQEVGGVMVTLAALCDAASLDMDACAVTELARAWGNIEKIRAKQAGKPRFIVNGERLFAEVDAHPHADLLEKLPHVGHDFAEEVLALPLHELQRRVLIQKDWLAHYSTCLDGLDLKIGVESSRDPRDIRRIVESMQDKPKFQQGQAAMFRGQVETIITQVRERPERQYIVGGGSVAWEHELTPMPSTDTPT